jgi:YbaB/EbfC DNA-binding family
MSELGPPDAGRTPDVVGQLGVVRGSGQAHGGVVRVVLDGTGNLLDLVIEPKAVRLGSEELTAAVRTAFDGARQDVQSRLSDLEPAYAVTPEDTKATLDEVQVDAGRRLDGLMQIAEELSAKLDRLH